MTRSALPGAEDTIAALATPPGRSAIAVLRVSGPHALAIAARLLDPWRDTPRSAYRATLRDTAGQVLDRPVVTVYRGPRSYTGEDLVELSVHGGRVSPARALRAVLTAGARAALPGEFTRRAVMAGKLDLLQAEAIGDLIDAESRAMHDVALSQLDGRLSHHVGALRDAVLDVEAMIAYDIDFPEEDSGPIDPARVRSATDAVVRALDRLLGTVAAGEIVRRGARVVLTGAPNVGKSSLFNALVGDERAIVTEYAGTTRDAIEAVVEVGAWPVRLVDTAGVRETADPIEQLGVAAARRAVAGADVLVACGDDAASLAAAVRHARAHAAVPVIAVRTKCDLLPPGYQYTDRDDRAHSVGLVADSYLNTADEAAAIAVSARSGEGLDALAARLAAIVAARAGRDDAEADAPPMLTRERHREAIHHARAELAAFAAAWSEGAVPVVVAAVHLRSAAAALESLIGTIDVEDVLDVVFRSFCVGK